VAGRSRRSPDDGLRSILRARLPMVQWTSIETGMTQGGVPDLEGCYQGAQTWVECKATRAWAVKFSSSEQVGWHLRRAREGGSSWIAVRRRHEGGPRLGPPVDELWLVPGREALGLSVNGLNDGWMFWGGSPSRWDWGSILDRLFITPGRRE
jgi:hypothetical protein